MLARQRLAFPRVHEQHVVFDGAGERHINGVGDEAAGKEVVPGAQHELRALVGTASSASVRNRTPFQWLLRRLHVVTQ